MAKEILLTSESFVKSVTAISDNMAGKYLRPSIIEAQSIGLREIIGSKLLNKLKALVEDNSITAEANADYKELLDRAQSYLAYRACVEVTEKVAYKIANFGVVKTKDENLENASPEEISRLQYYYKSKADHFCRELQSFILQNRADYPELDNRTCDRMHSSLLSAASCGIFLGGPRGKRLPGRRVSNKDYIK